MDGAEPVALNRRLDNRSSAAGRCAVMILLTSRRARSLARPLRAIAGFAGDSALFLCVAIVLAFAALAAALSASAMLR